ncbi:hypothetical protein NHP194004_15630 [Helicobacter suis]|nr:hypothetical protein NHP194004_15630 [Helicobacter suis]
MRRNESPVTLKAMSWIFKSKPWLCLGGLGFKGGCPYIPRQSSQNSVSYPARKSDLFNGAILGKSLGPAHFGNLGASVLKS